MLTLVHSILEHLDRAGHRPDFVATGEMGDRCIGITRRKLLHRLAHTHQRPADDLGIGGAENADQDD